MIAKVKRIIKPFYLCMYDVINSVYFNNFITSNREKIIQHNKICKELPEGNILILAPHIDDDVIGCGGAILSYLKQNKKVSIVYLTNSGKQGIKGDREAIIAERKKEAMEVAINIGIPKEDLYFLDGEDGNLINSNINNSLLNIIQKVNPTCMFLPCLLDTHMDHYAVTVKLYEIFKEYRETLENVGLYLYESQSPFTGFYSNIALDITDTFSIKQELMKLYKSQPSDFKFAKSLNKLNGMAFGKDKLYEFYIKVDIGKYCDFYNTYYKEVQDYLKVKDNLIPNGDSRDLIKSYKSSYEYKNKLEKLVKK